MSILYYILYSNIVKCQWPFFCAIKSRLLQIDYHNKKAPTFFMTGSFWFNLWLLAAAAKCTHTWLWLSHHVRRVQGRRKKMIVVDKSSTCGVHNLNRFINYLSKIGGDQSPKPHTFRRLCMHHVCLQIWMYGLYRENQVGKELGDLGLHTRLLGLMAAPFWCTMH